MDAKYLIAAAMLLAGSPLLAGGSVSNVQVSQIGMTNDNVVFVRSSAASVPGKPACSTDPTWQFAFAATKQTYTSMVVTARAINAKRGGSGKLHSRRGNSWTDYQS